MGPLKLQSLHSFVFFLVFLIFPVKILFGVSEGYINNQFIHSSKTAKESVVSILIYREYLKNNERILKKVGYGSGTVYKGRYIITNYHVVSKGNHFQILNSDGRHVLIKPFSKDVNYYADPKTDIAVLLIDPSSKSDVKSILFSDSRKLKEGEWVIAIGNPYSLGLSITAGIVSSKGRDNIGFTDIEDFIQTDASINPGNSGGPLVNLQGEMVGINTAIHSSSGGYQGISFAIPSNIVKRVVHDLIQYGRVRRGWMGFIARERREKGMQKSDVEILSIIKNSPSEDAGLKKGDIFKEIDGESISSVGSVVRIIGNKYIGETIPFVILRKNRLLHFRITLKEKKDYKEQKKSLFYIFQRYGIEFDELSDEKKIIVSYVNPTGARYNLRKGDIVLEVNNEGIDSINELLLVIKKCGNKIQSFKIMRDSMILFVNF